MSEVEVAIEKGEFIELTEIPEGDYKVNKPWWDFPKTHWWECFRFPLYTNYAGFLCVDKKEDGTTGIMWTSHGESHFPLKCGRNAVEVYIDQNGNLRAFFESAITMHIQWMKNTSYNEKEEHDRGLNIARGMLESLKIKNKK